MKKQDDYVTVNALDFDFGQGDFTVDFMYYHEKKLKPEFKSELDEALYNL